MFLRKEQKMNKLIIALVALFGFMGTANAFTIDRVTFQDGYYTQVGNMAVTELNGVTFEFGYDETVNGWYMLTPDSKVWMPYYEVRARANTITAVLFERDHELLQTLHTNLANLREEVTWIPLNDETDFNRLDQTVSRIKAHVIQIDEVRTRMHG